jgi:ribosomal protein S18 acetylase RimI-like enzyme
LLPADGGADALEEELLAVGRAEKLFARTPDAQADAPSWVCFEGPPTARLAREEAGVTVRQPLSALVCVVPQHLAGDEGGVVRGSGDRSARDGRVVVTEEDGRCAAIEPVVTPELRREGIAQELVSQLQRLRRDLGFAVSDRIRLRISAPDEAQAAITEYTSWIANEPLARELSLGELAVGQQAHDLDLDGSPVRVAISKEL